MGELCDVAGSEMVAKPPSQLADASLSSPCPYPRPRRLSVRERRVPPLEELERVRVRYDDRLGKRIQPCWDTNHCRGRV